MMLNVVSSRIVIKTKYQGLALPSPKLWRICAWNTPRSSLAAALKGRHECTEPEGILQNEKLQLKTDLED